VCRTTCAELHVIGQRVLRLRVIGLRVLGLHVLELLFLEVVLFLFETALMATNWKYKNCFIILVIINSGPSLFWHVTQSRFVVGYPLLGQLIGPIFKSQAAREE
jgi:hypothetical protein